jgi:ring-1,2-phenylacetyl-CoA epoxidase subunit PaaE
MEKSRIKVELFGTNTPAGTSARACRARPSRATTPKSTVVLDGTRRSFTMNKNQDNVVDAGLKAGLEMPIPARAASARPAAPKWSRAKVDMDINFALEDYEVARGFVLCCQSYPVTDKAGHRLRPGRIKTSGDAHELREHPVRDRPTASRR